MVKNSNELNFAAYLGLYSFYRLFPFFEYIYILHFLIILINSLFLNKLKILKEDIYFYFFSISFLLFDFMVYDLNPYAKKQIPYIFMSLFGFFLSTKIKNIGLVYKNLYMFLTIDFFSRIFSTQILKWEDNYMSYSYALLFPTTIFILIYFEKKNKRDLVLSCIGIQQIFGYGARGTIISLLISIAFLKLFYLSKSKKERYICKLVTVIVLIYVLHKKILTLFFYFWPNVRTIRAFYLKFVTGELNKSVYGFTSGRDKLYDKGIEEILNNPIKGHGFFGYILPDGNHFYIHNIFLEILHQYGIFLFILILSLTLVSFLRYQDHQKKVKKIVFILFIQTIIKLLVTGSYLTTPYFWAYYGIVFNKRLINKKLEKRKAN